MFKITISTAGDAFGEDDPSTRNDEVARILRVVAGKIADGREYGATLDSNGNVVGAFGIVHEEA